MIHSEIILLELIKLYYDTSSGDCLNLDNLEKAFYTIEELAGNFLDIILEYDFYQEFDKFEEICEDTFYLKDDQISFLDEEALDLLEDVVLLSLEGEDLTYDGFISDIIHNICIYKDLNIKPCLQEYSTIFYNCLSIVQNYINLAYMESKKGTNSPVLISFMKRLVALYENDYAKLNAKDLDKINVILAYLNDMYLTDDPAIFANTSWYIILFSKDEKELSTLNYLRILNSIEEEETTLSNYDEDTFFIRYYTIYLNNYLKEIENQDWKEELVLQKYLLISTQPSVEAYFFKEKSLDGLNLPSFPTEWLTTNTFSFFFDVVLKSIDELSCKDQSITNKKHSHMATCALFIRCFLNLSINEEEKKEIEEKILLSNFYHKDGYQIASNLVDEIIFRDLRNHIFKI